MTKKILTILTATLMVSGAWADTVDNQNICYTITSSNIGSATFNNTTQISKSNITANATAIITNKKIYSGSAVSTYNISTYSILNGETNIDISRFSNTNTDSYELEDTEQTYHFVSRASDYNNHVATILAESDIFDLSQVATKTATVKVNGNSVPLTTIQSSPYYTNVAFYQTVVEPDYINTFSSSIEYVAILNITVITRQTGSVAVTKTYTPTSITANFLTPVVTSLNIPSTVTTIADNAFQNVSASLTSITATGNFVVENNMLMNTAKTIVYYVLPGANNKTIELLSTVTTIKPNALQNCTGVTLNSTNASLSVGDNQGSNTINKPEVLSVVAGKVTGIVTNSNFNTWLGSATKPAESTCIDFTEAVFMENITTAFNIPDNCIIYFPATKNDHSALTVNANRNAVIGGVCSNLQITDNKAWNVTKTFTADVTFNRSMPVDKWGTVMLPFELTVSGAWVGEFSGYSEGSITFTKRNTLAANTPYLFRNLGSFTSFSKLSATIPVTNKSDIKFGDATFKGVYQQTTLNSGYDYAYTTNGDFIKCNGNKLNPFRAYFYITSTSSAPQMRFLDEDEQEIFFEGNANDIEAIEEVNVNETIYDLNGKQVEAATAGMYIKNGKKIIIK